MYEQIVKNCFYEKGYNSENLKRQIYKQQLT